jgi:hypothetical protein
MVNCDVFLGGTCNGSEWRTDLIKKFKGITYFNPVITDRPWTESDQENEQRHKRTCKYMLFVITPKMEGFYSIAEVVESSFKKPGRTIYCVIDTDGEKSFNDVQKNSLRATGRLLQSNKAIVKQSLDEVAEFLNHSRKPREGCNIF